MTVVFIIFLIVVAIINLAIGYALGWYRILELLPFWHGEPRITAHVVDEQAADAEVTRSTEFLSRLQELATNVQDLAGQHSTRVGEITQALDAQGGAESDPASVLAAATAIIKANRQLEEELASTKLEIEVRQRQLETTTVAARTDALTGILNRRAYDEELALRFSQAQRSGAPLCLLLFDVDHFKKFNDEFGHQAGDAVLRGVAQVLTRTQRETDVLARYGGEEFCALLPATSLEEAKLAAERLRLAIAEAEFEFEGKRLRVTVSVGLAASTESLDSAHLVKRADTALYEAKKNGRDCTYYHNGEVSLPVQIASASFAQSFSSVQRIAPYIDGRFPTFSKFREVHCEELSFAGFSFLSTNKPPYEQWAVAFGTAEEPFFRLALVSECLDIGAPGQNMFRISCAFTDQINPADEPVAEQSITLPPEPARQPALT